MENYPSLVGGQSPSEPDHNKFSKKVMKLICKEFELNSEPKFERIFDLTFQMLSYKDHQWIVLKRYACSKLTRL